MEIPLKGLRDPMGIPISCWRLHLGPTQRLEDLLEISQRT